MDDERHEPELDEEELRFLDSYIATEAYERARQRLATLYARYGDNPKLRSRLANLPGFVADAVGATDSESLHELMAGYVQSRMAHAAMTLAESLLAAASEGRPLSWPTSALIVKAASCTMQYQVAVSILRARLQTHPDDTDAQHSLQRTRRMMDLSQEAINAGYGCVDTLCLQPDPESLSLVPASLARTYTVLPFRTRGGRLSVALAAPSEETLAVLEAWTEREVVPALALRDELAELIDRVYGA